jgi:hypothetical protein
MRISAGALGIAMIVAIRSAKWAQVDSLEALLGFDEFEYLALFRWLAIAGPGDCRSTARRSGVNASLRAVRDLRPTARASERSAAGADADSCGGCNSCVTFTVICARRGLRPRHEIRSHPD